MLEKVPNFIWLQKLGEWGCPTRKAADWLKMTRKILQWMGLIAVSFLVTAFLSWAGLPAALLLGPMISSIIFGLSDSGLRLPPLALFAGQAIIGCMVARVLEPNLLGFFANEWPKVLLGVAVTVFSGGMVGFLMARYSSLPALTSAWGSAPGAAAVMVVYAGEFGADMQMVALMQYLRVIIVVLSASTISHLVFGVETPPGTVSPAASQLSASWGDFAITLGVAVAGGWLGRRLKVPGGVLLIPLIACTVLKMTGCITVTLPPWLLAISYAVLGWYIGLGFNRRLFFHAVRVMPQIITSALFIVSFCGIFAWLMSILTNVDALTAFLATSPGGIDAVAIIAVASHANISLVMATQIMRFFAVLATGPAIARWISRHGRRIILE